MRRATKREGTGEPQTPDISLDASVKMRELRFEEVPDPDVRFRGSTARNSVWRSRRKNLPDEAQEDVVYSDAAVRLRIATEVVGGGSDLLNSSSEEREKTSQQRGRQRTVGQETETKEEKK